MQIHTLGTKMHKKRMTSANQLKLACMFLKVSTIWIQLSKNRIRLASGSQDQKSPPNVPKGSPKIGLQNHLVVKNVPKDPLGKPQKQTCPKHVLKNIPDGLKMPNLIGCWPLGQALGGASRDSMGHVVGKHSCLIPLWAINQLPGWSWEREFVGMILLEMGNHTFQSHFLWELYISYFLESIWRWNGDDELLH